MTKKVPNGKEVLALFSETQENVIATGAGSMPNVADPRITNFLATARTAMETLDRSGTKRFDFELLGAESKALARMVSTVEKAANLARFKTPAKAATPEELRIAATTIRVGNTVIRPMAPVIGE